MLLFYTKNLGSDHIFDDQYIPLSEGTMQRWKGEKQQAYCEDGRRKATSEEAVSVQRGRTAEGLPGVGQRRPCPTVACASSSSLDESR